MKMIMKENKNNEAKLNEFFNSINEAKETEITETEENNTIMNTNNNNGQNSAATSAQITKAIVTYYPAIKGNNNGKETKFTNWFRYHTELGYMYPTRDKNMDEEYVIRGTKQAVALEIIKLGSLDMTSLGLVLDMINDLVEQDYKTILINNQSWVSNYNGEVKEA